MRRVACVSTVVAAEQQNGKTSSGVIDIFNDSRSFNIENQITGAFIVSNPYLLMIFEGEATVLANIVFRFRQDARLKDFSLIQNTEIQSKEFTSWGIKSLKEGQVQSRFYEKLNNIFKDNLDLKSRLDEQRLDVFVRPSLEMNQQEEGVENAPESRLVSVTRSKFEGARLAITGWPKPGKVKLTPELIKLCARLVRKPLSYDALLSANIVENEEALLVYLKQLNRIGILRKYTNKTEENLVNVNGGIGAKRSATPDRFGAVLRNFLTAARR